MDRERRNSEAERCETCRHFGVLMRFQQGECRKRAPIAIEHDELRQPAAVWPWVNVHWWCGDYEQGED